MWKPMVVAAVCFGLAACGPGTVAEQVSTHDAALSTTMDKLAALGELAKAAPRVTENAIAWPAEDVSATYPKRNIVFIQLEDFEDLGARPKLDYRVNNRSPWCDVAALTSWTPSGSTSRALAGRYIIMNADNAQPDNVEKLFSQFLDTRYVLVARTHSYEPARMVGASEFEPAKYRGDALVFALDPPKLLGGVTISAANTGRVQTRLGRNNQNLAADLHVQVQGQVLKALKALTPSLKDVRISL
ncbi:MAG: hypothetical protein ACI9MR_002011 [Myxococcota bacterium]|jgi:hypothetical protein